MLTALYAVVYLAGCFALGVACGLTLPSPTGMLAAVALLAWWYGLGTGAVLDWWGRRPRPAARRAGEDPPCS